MFTKFLAIPAMLIFAAGLSVAQAAPDSGNPVSRGASTTTTFVDPLRVKTGITNPLGTQKPPRKPLAQVKAVPEPSQWILMLAGLGLVGYMVRRGRRK